ncbi:LytR C-terminal domain-containing protein [Myceligenerans crystallogenes]|uniref:LytR/CpsA/Psr regulator C-terminal domain-containing protein n=1 Tax=Myceligenerans crystallogenes TaxID=316335 RepID=A0ABP4ZK23_9MICO
MTNPSPDSSYDEARVARRKHEHERQAVVFGVIIAFLAVCGIFALAMFTGSLVGPFQREFTVVGVSQQEEVPAPCLPEVEGQPDGALPLPYANVKVNALNASTSQGVAKAFETVLVERGFTVLELGDASVKLEASELRFGKKGIVAAYTLAAQFPSSRLVLDDRTGETVDLLVGEEFDKPLDVEDVEIAADEPLTNAENCVPASEITPKERLEFDTDVAEEASGEPEVAEG